MSLLVKDVETESNSVHFTAPVGGDVHAAVFRAAANNAARMMADSAGRAVSVRLVDGEIIVNGISTSALRYGLEGVVQAESAAAEALERLAESQLGSCVIRATDLGLQASACRVLAEHAQQLLDSMSTPDAGGHR